MTVFITGTSTGFGKLITTTLAKAGHHVIAGMRNINGNNAAAAKELSALPNVTVVEIDITDDASVANAFKPFQQIDVLINNAGVTGMGILEAYSIAQIKKIFEVNFFGVLRTYQAVLPGMRAAKNGLIINITTAASGHTLPFMIPYISSKIGVESITEGIQDELKAFGIENVTIQPGPYPTEMNSGIKPGINADKPEIMATYEDADAQIQALGTVFQTKMKEFNVNPQTIADEILGLINMPKGTRPLRLPLDAIAEGTDKAFIAARQELKAKWVAKYSPSGSANENR